MKLAGHFFRHSEIGAKFFLCEPNLDGRNRGRQRVTYCDRLKEDSSCENTDKLSVVIKVCRNLAPVRGLNYFVVEATETNQVS